MQRYDWENTFNARDLGYTPTTTGNYVKGLRFIRSDAPCKIAGNVKDFLAEKNIRTIIDFGRRGAFSLSGGKGQNGIDFSNFVIIGKCIGY